MTTSNITYVQGLSVTDPDSGLLVEVSIYKDSESGAMVGIDSSYLTNTDELLYSPYNLGTELIEVD